MKNTILFALAFTAIVFVFTIFSIETALADGDPFGCLFIGGPDYECPRSELENCFCDDVVKYG